jgi:hypothetical protein
MPQDESAPAGEPRPLASQLALIVGHSGACEMSRVGFNGYAVD